MGVYVGGMVKCRVMRRRDLKKLETTGEREFRCPAGKKNRRAEYALCGIWQSSCLLTAADCALGDREIE